MDLVEPGLAPHLPLPVAGTGPRPPGENTGSVDGGRLRNVAFRGASTGYAEKKPARVHVPSPPPPVIRGVGETRAVEFLQWVLGRAGLGALLTVRPHEFATAQGSLEDTLELEIDGPLPREAASDDEDDE